LFESEPVFRRCLRELDWELSAVAGYSILPRLYSDKRHGSAPWEALAETHPALVMVQYALFETLVEAGVRPDYVLGASLGEFVALAAASVLDRSTLLRAVVHQAAELETCCPLGGMLAVLTAPELHRNEPVLYENCEIAAINSCSHFVVSGAVAGLTRVATFLKARDVSFQWLPVSRPFHSSLMDGMAERYREFSRELRCASARLPIVSCAAGGFLDEVTSDYLWRVVRHPIRFQHAIELLESREQPIYVDLGPSGTMANLAKYSLPRAAGARTFATLTPFGNDLANLNKVMTRLAESRVARTS
jgi:acyl transferase domain-containing protein